MLRTLVILLIVAAILFLGWREPLRDRFMNKAETHQEEPPPTPDQLPQTPH